MNLIRKFLLIWLTRDELCDLLALDTGQYEQSWWALAGRVEAETQELGVWIKPIIIQDSAGNMIDKPEDAVLLLPWRYIKRATIHAKKPDKIGPIGFKPG